MLLAANPDITDGSYVTYSCLSESDYGVNDKQQQTHLPRSQMGTSSLQDVSDQLSLEAITYEAGVVGPEDGTVDRQIIAVTSQVLVGGEIYHIPMLDFNGYKDLKPNHRGPKEALLRLGLEGYLVDSGNGCHFWGVRLMDEGEWRQMMIRCVQDAKTNEHLIGDSVFDLRFLEFSLSRGFSALRLFGYSEKSEPKIVDVIR